MSQRLDFLQVGKAIAIKLSLAPYHKKLCVCLAWSLVGHALRPIRISDWSKFDRYSEFMWKNLCSIWKLVY